MRIFDLGIEMPDIVEKLEGKVVAHLLGRRLGTELHEERFGVRDVHFLGNSARHELGEEGVHRADDSGPLPPKIPVALGEKPEDLDVIGRLDLAQRRSPQGGDGY